MPGVGHFHSIKEGAMGDTPKKPEQTAPKDGSGWKPKDSKKWTKHDAPPDPKGSIPDMDDWDPNDPKINHGRVVTFDIDTRVFKVMCCGMTYQINWDDLFAKAPKNSAIPARCEKPDTYQEYLTDVWDENNYFWMEETPCVLILNCFITWQEKWTKYRCTSKHVWEKTATDRTVEMCLMVTNTFTCCSD
jgi:hypothetical protein